MAERAGAEFLAAFGRAETERLAEVERLRRERGDEWWRVPDEPVPDQPRMQGGRRVCEAGHVQRGRIRCGVSRRSGSLGGGGGSAACRSRWSRRCCGARAAAGCSSAGGVGRAGLGSLRATRPSVKVLVRA
jgi:hypothetical protein